MRGSEPRVLPLNYPPSGAPAQGRRGREGNAFTTATGGLVDAIPPAGGAVGGLVGTGEPGEEMGRGVGALGMAVVGLAGAVASGARLRTGMMLMAASALGGVLLEPDLYLVGAVLLAAAVAVGLRVGVAEG